MLCFYCTLKHVFFVLCFFVSTGAAPAALEGNKKQQCVLSSSWSSSSGLLVGPAVPFFFFFLLVRVLVNRRGETVCGMHTSFFLNICPPSFSAGKQRTAGVGRPAGFEDKRLVYETARILDGVPRPQSSTVMVRVSPSNIAALFSCFVLFDVGHRRSSPPLSSPPPPPPSQRCFVLLCFIWRACVAPPLLRRSARAPPQHRLCM